MKVVNGNTDGNILGTNGAVIVMMMMVVEVLEVVGNRFGKMFSTCGDGGDDNGGVCNSESNGSCTCSILVKTVGYQRAVETHLAQLHFLLTIKINTLVGGTRAPGRVWYNFLCFLCKSLRTLWTLA